MTNTSREYAEALCALGAEEGKTAEYESAVTLMEEALGENPGFLDLLASPAVSRKERMDILRQAFQGKIPLPMLTLLRLMIYRGHARELPRMAESFHDLIRESRGESIARVFSAVELTEEEKSRLREKLEKRFGRHFTLECEVDSSLLGGVRVETEGRVLDGTLKARLQEIKEVMDS